MGEDANVTAVMDVNLQHASGVPQGDFLLRLTDAIAAQNQALLASLRHEGGERLGEPGLIDAMGVASGFNAITRVADATGIPLDGFMADRSAGVREAAGINQFRERKVWAE